MAKRLALVFLTGASVAVLGTFAWAPGAFTWLLPVLVMGFPIALVTLAVSRSGRVGRVRRPLWALFVMLELGALGVVALDGSARSLLGLPLSLHVLLLFVWLGPLFVTTLAYRATFPELGIDEELLTRLEELRRAR